MEVVSQLVTSLTNTDLTEVSKNVSILARRTIISIGTDLVSQPVPIHTPEDTKPTEIIVMNPALPTLITSIITLVGQSAALLSSPTTPQTHGLAAFLVTPPQCSIGITPVLIVISLFCLLKLMIFNTVITLAQTAHIFIGTRPAQQPALILSSKAL